VCGRTTSTVPRDTLADLLNVDEVDAPELPPSWNVAPTQPMYTAATTSTGARKLRALRWGLVPNWGKGPRTGGQLINARSETLHKRPAFRSLLGSHRAIVPVSGFYEWRQPEPGTEGAKQPFYFYHAGGGPLAFAGLWDIWSDGEGQPLRSCTIITTAANETVAPVHNRMPVVLSPEDWDEWLGPGQLPVKRLGELLAPAPAGLLAFHAVGRAVNKALNDGPELILPVTTPSLLFPAAGPGPVREPDVKPPWR